MSSTVAPSVAEPAEAPDPTELPKHSKARMVRQAHHPVSEPIEVLYGCPIRALSPSKRPSPPKPEWFDKLTIRSLLCLPINSPLGRGALLLQPVVSRPLPENGLKHSLGHEGDTA